MIHISPALKSAYAQFIEINRNIIPVLPDAIVLTLTQFGLEVTITIGKDTYSFYWDKDGNKIDAVDYADLQLRAL